MDKKYSVLMSAYIKDNADWLDLSIKCMLDQTIKPSEFVIIEDGKLTDELNAVINDYFELYPDIFKIVRLEKNVGLGPALKRGVEECSNEYIARMDSDDYSLPNRMEKQFEIFEKYPEVSIVGSNISEFFGSIDNVICNVILPETNEEIIKFSKKRNPFRHSAVTFKKSAVLKSGSYREYYLCEDYDMWLRMIRCDCKCYNVQEICSFVRINEDFYKRRGGHKYFKSINKFKKEQLHNGYFTLSEYIVSIVPHLVICYMPNFLREFIYKNLLRKKIR